MYWKQPCCIKVWPCLDLVQVDANANLRPSDSARRLTNSGQSDSDALWTTLIDDFTAGKCSAIKDSCSMFVNTFIFCLWFMSYMHM